MMTITQDEFVNTTMNIINAITKLLKSTLIIFLKSCTTYIIQMILKLTMIKKL